MPRVSFCAPRSRAAWELGVREPWSGWIEARPVNHCAGGARGAPPATGVSADAGRHQKFRVCWRCQDPGGGREGLPPAACHYLPHLFRGPWKKYGVRKFPLAPFYPPFFCPRQARDQRNVDSPSAAVWAAARGLLCGQEQMAVAQVDRRLVSAVARPIIFPPTRLLLGGTTPLPLPPTTTSWGAATKLGMLRVGLPPAASCQDPRAPRKRHRRDVAARRGLPWSASTT